MEHSGYFVPGVNYNSCEHNQNKAFKRMNIVEANFKNTKLKDYCDRLKSNIFKINFHCFLQEIFQFSHFLGGGGLRGDMFTNIVGPKFVVHTVTSYLGLPLILFPVPHKRDHL